MLQHIKPGKLSVLALVTIVLAIAVQSVNYPLKKPLTRTRYHTGSNAKFLFAFNQHFHFSKLSWNILMKPFYLESKMFDYIATTQCIVQFQLLADKKLKFVGCGFNIPRYTILACTNLIMKILMID